MTAGSMLEPPPKGSLVQFAEGFGQRVLLTIDTEEEFDWSAPFSRDAHSLSHVEQIAKLQAFCEEIGAIPLYLVDWPIVQNDRAVEIISDAVARGHAEFGAQLHPWVTPPFDEELSTRNSYPGNLPAETESAKFAALFGAISERFGTPPQIYRAGRYGVGPNTAQMLSTAGVKIDTSIRPLFDYSDDGGPDFTHHPSCPYWIDENRTLIELPITTVYWGVLRQLGGRLHRLQRHVPTFFAGFSKLSLLERIALTPEGVTAEEAVRGIDIALDEQLPLLVLSLHSPSLAPGNTPYAKTADDVERIYDWLRQIYAYLDRRNVKSTTIREILAAAEQ